MSFSKISALSGLVALASKVAAHGVVTGIVADGIYYQGYDTNFQYMASPPEVVGWSDPEDQSRGPITPDQYATSDMICHLGATNAKISAPVAAGGKVELQWTAWPVSHHGPVIDYLANCGGDCTTVDKTTLEWFKIDGVGLIDDTTVPGNWASDTLIANNNSWTVTLPSDIASGNYVLRHEIIALHSAGEANGAQNYPQCVNLQITGTGTATPSGVLGTALYTATDPGILVNIYTALASYVVPGPALYSGAATSDTSATSAAPVASSAAETTAVVASSAAAEATVVTSSAPVVTSAPYGNSTTPTSSKKSACKAKSSSASKKTKSACKAKSTSASLTVSALNVAAAVATTSAESVLTTFAASVTIATTTSAIETSAAAVATSTSSSTVTEPKGTTLGDLLSWLSSFYTTHSGTTYDANTVARRHARDLAQREMDKFSGEGHHHATGTVSGGPHPTHHHHIPSGTGRANLRAKPTGTHVLGSAMPTGARHFQAAGY